MMCRRTAMPFTLCPSDCETRHTFRPAASCERRLTLTTPGLLRALAFAAFALPQIAMGAAFSADTIRVASWNLEWLVSPQAFKPLKVDCTPEGATVHGDVRQIPCDV